METFILPIPKIKIEVIFHEKECQKEFQPIMGSARRWRRLTAAGSGELVDGSIAMKLDLPRFPSHNVRI